MKTLERLTIGVVALVTASCASTPPMQAPTVNVTGDWVGAWACDDPTKGNGLVVMKLTQSGGRTMGDVNVTGMGVNLTNAGAEAAVSGDEVVLTKGTDVTGSFKVTGDKMEGPFQIATCRGKLTMAREPGKGTVTTSRLRSVATTVTELDVPSRWITLRGPQGGTLTMQVDDRVRNLSQVSVGDTVTVAYYESWAVALDKPGDPSGSIVVRTAPAGQPPAVFAARRSTIKAKVTKIDAGKPSVTFMGPRQEQEVSVADDPRVLARLQVGETYDVTYTENLAVAVEKSAKR